MKEDWNIYNAKIGETIKNEYHEKWVKVGADDNGYLQVENSIKDLNKDLKIHSMSTVKVDDNEGNNYYLGFYCGGLNGGKYPKKWSAYLQEIAKLMETFKHAWLVDLTNDCCDDVWYLTIGFTI